MDDAEFMARGIDEQIQAIIDRERATGPEQLFYTGLPRFKVYSARAMQSDLSRFVPLTLLAIVVVLFVSFRSLRGVLLPALTILVSLIWTLGIMVLAGSSLSLGSIALPPLILVLGTAYSLHMVAEYYELARPDGAVREVVLEALKKTSPPICITALTTVLGFLSLGVNPLASIRVMGVFSSVGILIAFLLSILLVPAVLMQLRLPANPRAAFAPGVTTALQRIGRFAIQHRRSVIAAALLLAVVAIGKLSSIRVDSNFQSFFRPNDPVRQATDTINEHLVGSMAFYVVIDGREKDVMKQWDTLRRIKDLQTYIDSLPGVDKTVSFVDYCELLDRGAPVGQGGYHGRSGQRDYDSAATGKPDHLLAGAVSTPRRHAACRRQPDQLSVCRQPGLCALEYPGPHHPLRFTGDFRPRRTYQHLRSGAFSARPQGAAYRQSDSPDRDHR